MTQLQPRVIWTGPVDGMAMRVVDLGPAAAERLIVEIEQPPDAMGSRGWARMDPIPRRVFERMLVQAGVVPS